MKLIVIAISFLAIGCSHLPKGKRNPTNVQYLEPAQSEDEVRELLGSPDHIESTSLYDRWSYRIFFDDGGCRDYEIQFTRGYVSKWKSASHGAADFEHSFPGWAKRRAGDSDLRFLAHILGFVGQLVSSANRH